MRVHKRLKLVTKRISVYRSLFSRARGAEVTLDRGDDVGYYAYFSLCITHTNICL